MSGGEEAGVAVGVVAGIAAAGGGTTAESEDAGEDEVAAGRRSQEGIEKG